MKKKKEIETRLQYILCYIFTLKSRKKPRDTFNRLFFFLEVFHTLFALWWFFFSFFISSFSRSTSRRYIFLIKPNKKREGRVEYSKERREFLRVKGLQLYKQYIPLFFSFQWMLFKWTDGLELERAYVCVHSFDVIDIIDFFFLNRTRAYVL